MRKIKGFKLVLRPHEVKRRAKKLGVDLEASGFPDHVLSKTLERLAKSLNAGVLFDTFGHPDPDQPLLSPMPGLAYSLILAGLGEGFPPAVRAQETSLPDALWPALIETGLDECVRFASAIIADEAEKDNCELSPLTSITDPAAVEAAHRKLDGPKLGVNFTDGKLAPSAALVVSLSWLAKSKAKGRR